MAETCAELRKVEQQQGLPPELAAQYQQAEAMDQELDRSAEQQLQELEAELQRNPGHAGSVVRDCSERPGRCRKRAAGSGSGRSEPAAGK
ncbi:MAG UNVERIFIED_CONTAM: hypothetical protein LVR18_25225 [Planctomycetaceae bacterium]